jgi:hypothetical protein
MAWLESRRFRSVAVRFVWAALLLGVASSTGCSDEIRGKKLAKVAREAVAEAPAFAQLRELLRADCERASIVPGPAFAKEYEEGQHEIPVRATCEMSAPALGGTFRGVEVVGRLSLTVEDGEVTRIHQDPEVIAMSTLPRIVPGLRRALERISVAGSGGGERRGRAHIDVGLCSPRALARLTRSDGGEPTRSLEVTIYESFQWLDNMDTVSDMLSVEDGEFAVFSRGLLDAPTAVHCDGDRCRLCAQRRRGGVVRPER